MAAAAAAVLLLAGCSVGPGPSETGPSEAASSESAGPAPSIEASPPSSDSSDLPAVMDPSPPTALRIPSIGVGTLTLHLGLQEGGALEVPPDGPGAPASWYEGSPAPGERGPSIFLGHVNATDGGPGVFADLRSLNPGDTVEVAREDGSTATFAVDRGEAYAKDDFPTLQVYGNTDDAELRLITCDGYDPATGLFEDNYVVYASLVR
jgi:sortase (surface protein transpeptidase)